MKICLKNDPFRDALQLTMMSKLMTFIFLLMVSFYTTSGQSISDFKKMIGKPVRAYSIFSVSKHILMKPDFDKSGQVCRVVLVINEGMQSPVDVPFEVFKSVVDRIIPINKRGAKHEPFYSGYTLDGGAIWAIFTYEEVALVYSGSFDISNLEFRSEKRKEWIPSNLSNPNSNETVQTAEIKDDFANYKLLRVGWAQITWKKRKCE
jgi:hypothetical protein